jgi:hypothetical protein
MKRSRSRWRALFIHADKKASIFFRRSSGGTCVTGPGGSDLADDGLPPRTTGSSNAERTQDRGGALRPKIAEAAKLRIVSATFARRDERQWIA